MLPTRPPRKVIGQRWQALWLICVSVACQSAEVPVADPAAARGLALLDAKACTACHSTDGRFKVGPTFAGLIGRQSTVMRQGQRHLVTVDEAYVLRAIAEPDAEVVEGFMPRTMPVVDLSEAERADLLAGLRHLSAGATVAGVEAAQGSMWPLALAAIAFVLLHLLMSSRMVRDRAIARLGLNRFQGIYSLVLASVLICMIIAWTRAPFVPLWTPADWTRWIPVALMPLVYIGVIAGLTTKSPTMTRGEGQLQAPEPAVGIVRVTRHPMNLSIALWGLAHMPANGDVAMLLLTGSIATLGILGTWHIEARRRRECGQAWLAFTQKTSVVPFAAILGGRTTVTLKQIGWWRIGLGLAAYGSMLWLHAWIIGASALPQ